MTPEQSAAVAGLRAELANDTGGLLVVTFDDVRLILAALDEAQQDAARYVWVRDWLVRTGTLKALFCRPAMNAATGDWWVLHKAYTIQGDSVEGYGKTEDAAIDAARASAGGAA